MSAKALCVAAPLVMLMGAIAITARPPRLAVPALAVAALFVVGAGYSTFLTLRNAQVGAPAHERELASFQPLVDGQLRALPDHRQLQRAAAVRRRRDRRRRSSRRSRSRPATARPTPRATRSTSTSSTTRRWTASTSSSRPSARVTAARRRRTSALVRSTPSFRLCRRTGPDAAAHQVLPDEGKGTGARLDCDTPAGAAIAALRRDRGRGAGTARVRTARRAASAPARRRRWTSTLPGRRAGALDPVPQPAAARRHRPGPADGASRLARRPRPVLARGHDRPAAGRHLSSSRSRWRSPRRCSRAPSTRRSRRSRSARPSRRDGSPCAEACGEWVDALYAEARRVAVRC